MEGTMKCCVGDSINKMVNILYNWWYCGALKNILAVDELLASYCVIDEETNSQSTLNSPDWFIKEELCEYVGWHSGWWHRTSTQASGPHCLAINGLDIELDRSPLVFATACAALGLRYVLFWVIELCWSII